RLLINDETAISDEELQRRERVLDWATQQGFNATSFSALMDDIRDKFPEDTLRMATTLSNRFPALEARDIVLLATFTKQRVLLKFDPALGGRFTLVLYCLLRLEVMGANNRAGANRKRGTHSLDSVDPKDVATTTEDPLVLQEEMDRVEKVLKALP